jgi:hypothetical protein
MPRSRLRRWWQTVVVAAVTSAAAHASAQTAAPPSALPDPPSAVPTPAPPSAPPTPSIENERPPLGLFPTPEDALMDPRMSRSWGAAPARAFVSTTVDVGFVYVRPRVALGYGKPFTSWFGIEANPIAQTTELAAYAGLRLEIPYFTVRAGPRVFRAFTHTYLARQTSYTRLELETGSGQPAHAVTYEAEVDLAIPAGPGDIIGRGSISYMTGVPDGDDVFDETLHVIVQPPWVWRGRLGYAFRFGAYRQHSLGIIAEALDVPKRDDSLSVRAGPIVRFVLSRRVELRGSFVFPIISPDTLGIISGDFAELGVRYRWASE